MIEVIATMCLMGTTVDVHPKELLTDAATKSTCREIQRTYMVDKNQLNPYSCMLNAQKFAIEWLKTHPGYQVRLIGCRPERRHSI